MFVVYRITNTINGKTYHGYTGNFENRRRTHWYWGRQNHLPKKGVCRALVAAMQKYGNEAFTIKVVQECITKEDAEGTEMAWIALSNSTTSGHGYNLNAGGRGSSSPSKETRARMSVAQKRIQHTSEWNAKVGAAQRGRRKTPEQCARMSAAMKGRRKTPEQCARMSAAMIGRVPTDETRAKLRLVALAHPERQAKMAAARIGTTHTADTKAKMSAAHVGKAWTLRRRAAHTQWTHSPEAKNKIGVAHRGRTQTREHIAKRVESRLRNAKLKAEKVAGPRLTPVSSPVVYLGVDLGEYLEENPDLFAEVPSKRRTRRR